MTGRDITQYWKLETALTEIKRGRDSWRAHAAGSMLAGARKGDRLWILTSNQGRLCLVQHFVITDAGLTQQQAAELRGVDPKSIWESDCHVLGPQEWSLPKALIDVGSVAHRLRFLSKRNPQLKFREGKLDPQTLRALRVLTPESAALLARFWQNHVDVVSADAPSGSFDPHNVEDARRRIFASIAVRQGQPEFREALLRAYDGCCAITGADAPETLEAAHIIPYRGVKTNVVNNGLLLRADLHTLFDLGLIVIDTDTMVVRVARKLRKTSYGALEGRSVRLPQDPSLHPSIAALKLHRKGSKAWPRGNSR